MSKKIFAIVLFLFVITSSAFASGELSTPYPYDIKATDTAEAATLKAACNYDKVNVSYSDSTYMIMPDNASLYGLKINGITLPTSEKNRWSSMQIILSEPMTDAGTKKVISFVNSVIGELGKQIEKTETDNYILYKWDHLNMGITPMTLDGDTEPSFVIAIYCGNIG